VWESLERFARQGVQRLLQQVLEEEVEQALGRARYERREADCLPEVAEGVVYVDGVREKRGNEKAAA